MRLSLLIAVALLFGSVLASPTPMDPDPEDPYGPVIPSRSAGKARRKSSTPPDQGGSQGSSQGSHPSQSSESTDAGFGFIGGENKGLGSVKTQYIVSVFFLPIQPVLNAMPAAPPIHER
jgi:hypothetical protein